MSQTDLKKRMILRLVLAILFAGLSLFSLFLTVLSLIPQKDGLTVREEISVTSAPLNADNRVWQIEARGLLRNTSDKTITVEKITVTGDNGIILEQTEQFTLTARADYNLAIGTEATEEFDGTPVVTAVVNGKEITLRNAVNTPLLATVFPLALAILAGYLAYRSVLVYRCLLQEKALTEKTEKTEKAE